MKLKVGDILARSLDDVRNEALFYITGIKSERVKFTVYYFNNKKAFDRSCKFETHILFFEDQKENLKIYETIEIKP